MTNTSNQFPVTCGARKLPITYVAGHLVLTSYTEEYWRLTYEHCEYSESGRFYNYRHFSTGMSALLFFAHSCIVYGYRIPAEASLHLCECLESDAMDAMLASATPAIH